MLESIDSNTWLIIVLIIAIIFLTIIILGFILYQKAKGKIVEMELEHQQKENEWTQKHADEMDKLRKRKDTGLKSQLKGSVSEMLIPWMTRETGCTSTELRHYGDPIDWVGFKGMDKPDEKISIQFIEVKSGPKPAYLQKKDNKKSPLKDNELRVQEAVDRKDVHHQLIYINSKEVEEHLAKIGLEEEKSEESKED